MSLLQLFVITEPDAYTALYADIPTHKLTLLLQQNRICDIAQLTTLGDAEYISRYYTETLRLITQLSSNQYWSNKLVLNSYKKKLVDLNIELESATSPTIKALIEKSISSTNFAANKFIELGEYCERLPQIFQNISDDLNRENERSLNDLKHFIKCYNSLNNIEYLDENHKQDHFKLTESSINQAAASINVRDLIHKINLNIIEIGVIRLPEILFERIYKPDFTDINSVAIKELIKYCLSFTPIGPVTDAASAIVGIKNSKKNKSSDANSYIEGYENYNLSIEFWCFAVDSTIQFIESLDVNSYSELNKKFKSDSQRSAP